MPSKVICIWVDAFISNSEGGKMFPVWLAVLGCSDAMLTPTHGGSGIDLYPKLVVTPHELSYGDARWGEMRQKSFEVSNDGDDGSVLYVDRIFIDGAPGFRMVDDFHEFSLLKGDPPVSFTVSFSPLAPELHTGELYVESDDDAGPQLVFLDGGGIMPELQITPDPYNFGNVNVGCSRQGPIRLKNVGNDMLRIDGLALSNPAWTVENDLLFPVELQSGEVQEVTLRFEPIGVESYESALTVRSNEPIGARRALQAGAGIVPSSHEERFEMPAEPPVDIAIYLDPSCSMKNDQEALAEQFPNFIESFERITPNWQAILINTDDGCSLTGVLTPDTPNYEQIFFDATSVTSAGHEDYEEAGFTLLERALAETQPAGCNPGFMRDGAYLHGIFFSDEPEQSADVSGNPARTWDYFVDEFSRIKGGLSRVRISAVTGDAVEGCDSDRNHAEPGTGYIEATEATGGAWISICSDWTTQLDLIANATFQRASFVLTEGNPDPDTIEVRVNGEVVEGWTYDSASQTITFEDDAKPGALAEIVVTYDDLRACD